MARQIRTQDEINAVDTDFDVFFLPTAASLNVDEFTLYGTTDPDIDLSMVNVRHLKSYTQFRGEWEMTPRDTDPDNPNTMDPPLPYVEGDVVFIAGMNNLIYRRANVSLADNPNPTSADNTGHWVPMGVQVTEGVTANGESTPPTPPGLVSTSGRLSFRGYYGGDGVTIDNATGEIRASNFSLTDIRQFDTFAQLLAVDDNEWHIGDIGIITGGMNPLDATDDGEGTYVYIGSTSGNDRTGTTVSDDWRLLRVPHGVVQMVAGQSGPVVTAEQIADAVDSLIDLGELGNVTQTPTVLPGQHLIYSANADGAGNAGWVNHSAGSVALRLDNLADVEDGTPASMDRILVWDPTANSNAGEWQPMPLAELNIRGYTYDALTALTVNGLPSGALEDTIPKVFTGDNDPVQNTTGVTGFTGEGIRHRGDFYINTTDDTLWFYDGTLWAEVGAPIEDLNEVGNVVYEGMGSHTDVTRYARLEDTTVTPRPTQLTTLLYSSFGTPRITINAQGNTVVRVNDFSGTLQYDADPNTDPRIPFNTSNNYVVFVDDGSSPSAANRATTTIPYRLIAFDADANTITLEGSIPRALWSDTTTMKGIGDADIYVAVGATTESARPTHGQILTWSDQVRDSEGNLGAWINEDPEHATGGAENLNQLTDVTITLPSGESEPLDNSLLSYSRTGDVWINEAADTVFGRESLSTLRDVEYTSERPPQTFYDRISIEGGTSTVRVQSQSDRNTLGSQFTGFGGNLDFSELNAGDLVFFTTLETGFTDPTTDATSLGPFRVTGTSPSNRTVYIARSPGLNTITPNQRATIIGTPHFIWVQRSTVVPLETGHILIYDETLDNGNGSWANAPIQSAVLTGTTLDDIDDVVYDQDTPNLLYSVALRESDRMAARGVMFEATTRSMMINGVATDVRTLFAGPSNANFETGDFVIGDRVEFDIRTPPITTQPSLGSGLVVAVDGNGNPIIGIGTGNDLISNGEANLVNSNGMYYAYIVVTATRGTLQPGDVLVRSADGRNWVNETPDQMAANPNGGLRIRSLRDVDVTEDPREIFTAVDTGQNLNASARVDANSFTVGHPSALNPDVAVGDFFSFINNPSADQVFEVSIAEAPGQPLTLIRRDRTRMAIADSDIPAVGSDFYRVTVGTGTTPLADREILSYSSMEESWVNSTYRDASIISRITLDGDVKAFEVDDGTGNGTVDIPLAQGGGTPRTGLISGDTFDRIHNLPQAPTVPNDTSVEYALRVSDVGGNEGRVWVPLTEQDRLEFTESNNTAVLTGYRSESGTLTSVRDTDFINYDSNNANLQRLQLTLATFPQTPAQGFATRSLFWDVPYGRTASQNALASLGVSANNPVDFDTQFLNDVTTLTADSGNTNIDIGDFTRTRSATPAGGVPWTETFVITDPATYIRDDTTGLIGGNTVITYTLTDNLSNTYTATQNIDWQDANIESTLDAFPSRFFWERITSASLDTTLSGVSPTHNESVSWSQTPSGATSPFLTTPATRSGNSFQNDSLTFRTPLYHGINSPGSITSSVTFSRPAEVTGTAYTVPDSSTASVVVPTFTIPNLRRYVLNRDDLTVDDFLTGDFNTSDGLILNTANGGVTTTGIATGNTFNFNFTGAPRFYWFGFTIAPTVTFTDTDSNLEIVQETMQQLTFNATNLNAASTISNVPTGLDPVTYNFYGIQLNAGNNNVRITLS